MPASDKLLPKSTALRGPGPPQPSSHAGGGLFSPGLQLLAAPNCSPSETGGTQVLRNVMCPHLGVEAPKLLPSP